jgi:hypothetical protein
MAFIKSKGNFKSTRGNTVMRLPQNISHTRFLRALNYIIFSGSAARRGLWPPRPRGFLIAHNDVPSR